MVLDISRRLKIYRIRCQVALVIYVFTQTAFRMNNPWELDHFREELVSVNIDAPQPQQLFLSVRGPPRTTPKQPVAIIECGAAATTRWWTVVQRLLCPTLRVYCYDRAGLGRSGHAVVFPRTASSMAFELERLFETVGVEPPFIFITHSYGAIITREFLARLPSPKQSVVGMLFVESNQEKTHQELIVSSHLSTSLSGLNSLVSTGLHEDHQYSEAEVEAILKYESGTTTRTCDKPSAAISELENMKSSARALADREQLQKHILSPNPITVMRGDITRDLRRLLKTSGVMHQGAEEIESLLEQFACVDRQLQREILQLSHNARFVQAKKSGHHVEATEPELITAEVRRILKLVR